MKTKFSIIFATSILFISALAVLAAPAAPTTYAEFFLSIYELGQPNGEIQETLAYNEGENTFIIQVSTNHVEIFQIEKPFGEPIAVSSISTSGATDAAIADFNADGITDLVICNSSGQVLFGQGNGIFGNEVPFINCNGVATGEFNTQLGDDIIAATDTGLQIFVYNPENTDAKFDFSGIISPTVYINDVAVGLISHENSVVDQQQDFFAVGNDFEIVGIGNGDGTFSIDTNQIDLEGFGNKVEIVDIDQDGDGDIFIVDDIMSHAYKNQEGVLGDRISPNFHYTASDVAFGNFDNTPGLDIIWVTNTRSYLYTDWQNFGQDFGPGQSVVTVDLDGDGGDDFIINNRLYKGGAIRTTVDINPSNFTIIGERDEIQIDYIQFELGGNGRKKIQIDWQNNWITTTTDYNYNPSVVSTQSSIDFDATGLTAGIIYTDTLQVKTNDPENEKFTVPITFTVTAAEILISPEDIAVSIVQGITSPQQRSIRIENSGSEDVIIYPSDNQTWLSVESYFTLQAGEVKYMMVTMWPTGLDAGIHLGVISFETNKSYLDITDVPASLNILETFFVYLPTVIK